MTQKFPILFTLIAFSVVFLGGCSSNNSSMTALTSGNCETSGLTDMTDFDKKSPEQFSTRWVTPPVPPTRDTRTGFVVGGTNSSETIAALTSVNGISISDLEIKMRPGAVPFPTAGTLTPYSTAGFLGRTESLLTILVEDNRFVVDQKKLTHQLIARHLKILAVVPSDQIAYDAPFAYEGIRFSRKRMDTNGTQPSPFDDGVSDGRNVKVTNECSGKSLQYALLLPAMIERYGFYEGHGTSYRLEPAKILEVLDFLNRR